MKKMQNAKFKMQSLNKKEQSQGQILIIALILVGVFSVISLSIASQVYFEQKKAILDEKTQKAYYAAESGVEYGLNAIYNGSDPDGLTVNIGEATVTLARKIIGSAQTFSVPYEDGLSSGQSFSVGLSGYESRELTVCWDTVDTQADKVSFLGVLLYTDTTGETRIWNLAVNSKTSQVSRISGNSGEGLYDETTSPQVLSGQALCGLEAVAHSITLPLPDDAAATLGLADFFTVIPLYQNNVLFYFDAGNGYMFTNQGSKITAKAELPEQNHKVARTVSYYMPTVATPPNYLLFSLYAVNSMSLSPGRNWGSGL